MYTEEEAQKRWCPWARSVTVATLGDPNETAPLKTGSPSGYNRFGAPNNDAIGIPVSAKCIASPCMAWRWAPISDVRQDGEEIVTVRTGYCGLAGAPSND